MIVVVRPIQVVPDVLLTRPNNLDGAADTLGTLHRKQSAVRFKPTAKSSSEKMVMNSDFVLRKPSSFCD